MISTPRIHKKQIKYTFNGFTHQNKQSSAAENIYLGAEPTFGPKTVSAKLAEAEIEPAHADMMMKIFKQNLGKWQNKYFS